jgi:hypothetical protein
LSFEKVIFPKFVANDEIKFHFWEDHVTFMYCYTQAKFQFSLLIRAFSTLTLIVSFLIRPYLLLNQLATSDTIIFSFFPFKYKLSYLEIENKCDCYCIVPRRIFMENSYMFVAYYVRIDRFVNLETSEL